MKKILLFTAILALCSCSFSSNSGSTVNIKGSSSVTTASDSLIKGSRQAGEFTRINIGDIICRLTLTQEGIPGTITVEAPDNIMPLIVSDNRGGMLDIRLSSSVRFDKGLSNAPRITVCCGEDLAAITLSGASTMNSRDTLRLKDLVMTISGACDAGLVLDAGSLDIRSSGASKFSLSGNTDKFAINTSGATKAEASGLHCQYCDIVSSGACKIDIWCGKEATVKCSGGCSVDIYGPGEIVSKEVSGACKVNKK